ncbi:hypothetical protein KC363_g4735 [Hortaea werneckii]|nr:hypothetical protein KC325_g1468 [Hortaea werneckii]KAI6999156.1 hypothetical protein KC359_g1950 [Hortaea werneckii]KAI7148476.1 hypothetical protein KC344_g1906 [Hortaea werneckii]KAI7179211.1 hypothetical protein KC360_g1018 [Hortaea werneckii]KAI7189841.1 hypothetical protein KC363_g4735 [Hortaea werneckii]
MTSIKDGKALCTFSRSLTQYSTVQTTQSFSQSMRVPAKMCAGPLLLATLLAILLPTISAQDPAELCGAKSPSTIHAIDTLCGDNHIYVGDNVAIHQVFGDPGEPTQLEIYGDCSPAEYVPRDICKRQFHDICVGGNEHGSGVAKFGWHEVKCQTWIIMNDPTPPLPTAGMPGAPPG